jgi:hypothetical protein
MLESTPQKQCKLTRMKWLDYVCAWAVFGFGIVGIVLTETRHPPHAVLDTPLLWILVAMFNLLHIRNGSSVANLRIFCLGANVATLALEANRLKMFGTDPPGGALALFIFTETVFALRRR